MTVLELTAAAAGTGLVAPGMGEALLQLDIFLR